MARRGVNLILTGAIGAAFVGFLVGIEYGSPQPEIEPPPSSPPFDAATAPDQPRPALAYAAIPELRRERNRSNVQTLDGLRRPAPDLFREFTPDPDAKLVSLALRSERRAYNGAPPVIPHAVDTLGTDACLACHGGGVRLQGVTARPASHPYYENCVQCHAPPPPDIFTETVFAANFFDGVKAPLEGARAWTGAPPVIPHTTWMRDNCLACHGPDGWPGMETTHPWRDSCQQCHAPSSVLDLRPVELWTADFLPEPVIIDE